MLRWERYEDANLHQEFGQSFIAPVHCSRNTPFLPLHFICNDTQPLQKSLLFSKKGQASETFSRDSAAQSNEPRWKTRGVKERRLTQSLVLSDFVQHLALREAFRRQLLSVAHPLLQCAQTSRHVVQSLVQLALDLP